MPPELRTTATPHGSRRYLEFRSWINFATPAAYPATAAPIGLMQTGRPVDIQIMGPHLEHATPTDVAARLADIVGGFRGPKRYAALRCLATTVGLALIVAGSAVAARGEDVSPCGRAVRAGGDQLERLTTSALEQFFADALTKNMSFRFKDVRGAEPDPARPDPKHVERYTREFEDARPIEAREWREHLDATQRAIGLCHIGGSSLFFVNSREDVPYYLKGQAIQWAIRTNVWFVSAHLEIEEVYDVVFKVSGVRAGNVDGVILRSTVRRARQ